MTNSEILYAVVFIGVFPAVWILAAVLDRFLPDNSSHYLFRETRVRDHRLIRTTGTKCARPCHPAPRNDYGAA
jgi:hypothetical protein